MTTLVRLAKRHPDLDVTAFQASASLTCDWSSAVSFGLRSARQSLTLPSGYRRGEPVYDIVDELEFGDEAAASACLADETFSQVWADERLDADSIATLVCDEHVAKPGPIPSVAVKNYEIVTKRPDLDRAEFDRYWIEVHGPLASGIPTIRRYVQAHLAPGFRDSGAAPFDGLAITWFDDIDGMRVGAGTEVYQRTREDEENFLAGELPFIITTERVTYPVWS
jgi:uncharacterized protein (TIGR02118 family)